MFMTDYDCFELRHYSLQTWMGPSKVGINLIEEIIYGNTSVNIRRTERRAPSDAYTKTSFSLLIESYSGHHAGDRIIIIQSSAARSV